MSSPTTDVPAPADSPAPQSTRRERVGWYFYDWANSVFMTTVLQLFPIYFTRVAAAGLPPAEASRRFSLATFYGMAAIAALAPVLGAMADYARLKKRLLAAFVVLGVGATAGLYWVREGDWLLGTPEGDWVSMAVVSDGSYGVPEGLVSSFPVTTKNGEWTIVSGLEIDDFSRTRIDASVAELVEERDAVVELGLV